jgi:hypothetical protein
MSDDLFDENVEGRTVLRLNQHKTDKFFRHLGEMPCFDARSVEGISFTLKSLGFVHSASKYSNGLPLLNNLASIPATAVANRMVTWQYAVLLELESASKDRQKWFIYGYIVLSVMSSFLT